MPEKSAEARQADALEGIAMQLEWQNAVLMAILNEYYRIQWKKLHDEDVPPVNDEQKTLMSRANAFREMWKYDFHPEVQKKGGR